MPRVPPPDGVTIKPDLIRVNAGARFWRVHPQDRAVTEFNQDFSDDVFGGGRFDGTLADPYPFLYLAGDCETAVLETLARNLTFNQQGMRLVLRKSIERQCITALRLVRRLTLISLMKAEELAAIRQDEWLVQAEPAEYPQTRRWASWLRRQCPSAQGIIWPSRRNIGHKAIVLFGDRCDHLLEHIAGSSINLDSPAGALWLNARLTRYRVHVRPPAHHRHHGQKSSPGRLAPGSQALRTAL